MIKIYTSIAIILGLAYFIYGYFTVMPNVDMSYETYVLNELDNKPYVVKVDYSNRNIMEASNNEFINVYLKKVLKDNNYKNDNELSKKLENELNHNVQLGNGRKFYKGKEPKRNSFVIKDIQIKQLI